MIEEKDGKIAIYTAILSVIIILLITGIASAGFSDWIKKTITGRLTSQPLNMSIGIVGLNGCKILVWNNTIIGTDATPTEDGQKTINFTVTVSDADGMTDIDMTAIKAQFNTSNTVTTTIYKNETACTPVSGAGNQSATAINFTCGVDLWYWYPVGLYRINVTCNDYGNLTMWWNDTTYFQYAQLKAIKISPGALTWPSIGPGTNNVTLSNWTHVNNTGNYNATGNLQVKAYDLWATNGINTSLNSDNFTVDIDTGGAGCAPASCLECNGINMVNQSAQTITGAELHLGNKSIGNGSYNESLFYCLRLVPSIVPATYDTTVQGSWTVIMN